MTDLAIYDMDRTITRKATYTPFLLHCARASGSRRLVLAPLAAGSMLAYGLRTIDRARLKEINHRLLIGESRDRAELGSLAQGFADLMITTNILPGAVRSIGKDRAEGRRLVMATASYALYAEAIAEQLGFDDVVATRTMRSADDRVLAKIDGENCYGAAKMRMIDAWMAAENIDRAATDIRFYSDHHSDTPVFDWADEAVAVNPSGALRRLARQRGWRVEDWRR